MLKAAEVSELMGVSLRYVRKMAHEGKLQSELHQNAQQRPVYLFPLSALSEDLQLKYYAAHAPAAAVPAAVQAAAAPPAPQRSLDDFTLIERQEISWWIQTLQRWQEYRTKPGTNATDLDDRFILLLQLENPDRTVSVPTLYRKRKALQDGRLEDLLDNRGKALKGRSSINDTVWQVFLSFYLDLREPPALECYQMTVQYIKAEHPELAADIPTYSTFMRRLKNDLPPAVQVLGRKGKKAMRDRCAPYIRRMYDTLRSNEFWIADNHTFDIISTDDGGTQHRLYLTAFLDARSGIFTGCYVTTAPSSQSTVIALRKGILKYGIPENIYVDNGREFLTFDLGGTGHRTKKSKAAQGRYDPPPVLQRLGITMTNALVRNARAKLIERRFRDFKQRISNLFETYTGGNILEKPENLAAILRSGKIPGDKELTAAVEQLLEGYLNAQPYGGEVKADQGKPRIQVYNENLVKKRVPANPEDLNMLLMRSTRAQKVDRRGVRLTIGGQRLDYWTDEFLLHYIGQEVYLRYDPEDLSYVRAYDLQDRFIEQLPVDSDAVMDYHASAEQIKAGQRKTRTYEKLVGQQLAAMTRPEIGRDMRLRLALREAADNLADSAALPAAQPDIVTVMMPWEQPLLKAVGSDINLDRMIRNRIKETGGFDDE